MQRSTRVPPHLLPGLACRQMYVTSPCLVIFGEDVCYFAGRFQGWAEICSGKMTWCDHYVRLLLGDRIREG